MTYFCVLCEKRRDTELRRNSANAPHFHSKSAAFRQKALQSKDCGALQDGALRCGHQSAVLLPAKYGTLGGIKAARMPPCFQVLLHSICCILFDAYRMYVVYLEFVFIHWSTNGSLSFRRGKHSTNTSFAHPLTY